MTILTDLISIYSGFRFHDPTNTEKKETCIEEPAVHMDLLTDTWYHLSHLPQDIETAEKKITSDWKTIRMSRDALKQLRLGVLESKIALFLQKYETEKNSMAYQKVHQIGQLILTSPSLVYKKIVDGKVFIYEDGHCLFDAFAYAYYHLDGPTEEICTLDQLPREYLRQKVATYETANYDNDKMLADLVNQAIAEEKEKTILDYERAINNCDCDHAFEGRAEELKKEKEAFEKLDDVTLRQSYFERLKAMPKEAPLWGGQAELYSLSKIFKVTIHLETPDYPLKFNESASRSIILEWVNNNHFNAKLH